MPKVKITQSSSQSAPMNEEQCASPTPNIATPPCESEYINAQQRSTKRPCLDFSPTSEFDDFKEEMRAMLAKSNLKQEKIVENFMSKITLELTELRTQNEELRNIRTDLEESAKLMNSKYEDIRISMSRLDGERSEQRKYIDQLEKQIQDMHGNHRPAVIELRNISTKEKENVSDLAEIVMDVCRSLAVEVKPEEIRDVYRVQSKQGPSKQIVAEFQSVIAKNTVLRAVRDFNKGKPPSEKLNSEHAGITGERTPIYVAERLPATARKLFYDARKFAKSNGYQYCWIANGKIFIRKKEGEKPVLIISESSFQNLLHDKK